MKEQKAKDNKCTEVQQKTYISPVSITALPDLIKACKAIKESRCDEEFQDAALLCEKAYEKAIKTKNI